MHRALQVPSHLWKAASGMTSVASLPSFEGVVGKHLRQVASLIALRCVATVTGRNLYTSVGLAGEGWINIKKLAAT